MLLSSEFVSECIRSASTESPDQLTGCRTSSPKTAGQTAQQPAVEEQPMAGTLPGPQQADDQTPVPEQNTSAPSTNPDEADTTAPRELDLAEEQQPEVAQNKGADASARGKALVVVESANSGPPPPPELEAEEDEVEEVLGRPQDRRQHVYVSRYRNDEWVMHEEIPEAEETLRVERAAKCLVTEVQDVMKTARYRKRCFDQIEVIMKTNKELTAEVERLRRQLEATDQERTNREAQNQNLVGQLKNKEQEKTGLEAEVTRLQGENSRAFAECGRLKEDNEKLARRQSELQDHTNRMKDDLKILKVNAKRHLEAVIKERDD
ncbi:uncharacterized protein [Miscanthus floridulus]|uniref:uncharacterized protein isoform X2 n=1 Tax=Miscanthus floridulus TaxID=154761 RepID=UPI00345964BD